MSGIADHFEKEGDVVRAALVGDALDPVSESDSFGYVQYPLLPHEGSRDVFGDEEVTASGSISTPSQRARSRYSSSATRLIPMPGLR